MYDKKICNEKYIDIVDCYKEYGGDLEEILKCNYCGLKEQIENVLNRVPGYVDDIWLSDFIVFYIAREKFNNLNANLNLSLLDKTKGALDLLGKLLKERKIKTKRVKIYEWKDKSKGDWYIEYSGDIDPCKVNNDKELEGLIDEWKEEVLNQYEELVNKYGERSADSLFDLIPIERSECYEGEIKID